MSELQDDHYLRAVTELGDTHTIVTSQDIYSQNGVMLVASGVFITSKLYDRLVNDVLLKPLDMSLSSEHSVDVEIIWGDTEKLISGNTRLKKMADIIDQGLPLRDVICYNNLPAPLAFKLMVAREKFSDIYLHSLSIMILSVYLAHCDGMSQQELADVANASIFHDIGMLHIDPALFHPDHKMTLDERRHLYAHPQTAYLLLREFPELPIAIAEAVLEHHEMMDGRGYPRGLCRGKISRYGQIISVAEVSARAFETGSTAEQRQKIQIMFKMNFKQYGYKLTGYLDALRDDTDATLKLSEPGELVVQVRQISQFFTDFERYADVGKKDVIIDFAQSRLDGLKLALLEAGFNPQNPEELVQRFTDKPECRSEYASLLKEIFWQFNALVLEIARHWPDKAQANKDKYLWLGMMEQLLITA